MADARDRALDKIARLAGSGLDIVPLWHQAAEVLAGVVSHDGPPCWYTLDPVSLLITSHVNAEMDQMPAEWLAAEYYDDDVNTLIEVARSPAGISTLHEATGGDPTTSPRWIENSKYGADQEIICALRASSGQTWGAVGLYRQPGRPLFDDADKAFLSAAAPHLAEGAQRALLLTEAAEVADVDAPGVLVLSASSEVVSTTPQVEALLADMPGSDGPARSLPAPIHAVASRARMGEAAMVRLRGRSGRWFVVHGSPLTADGAAGVAVVIEPAHPGRIAHLLMAAYGLTEREQDIARAALRGLSTREMADELFISQHTVQEHLKHIFDKTGVRSRRDLVGKVFFRHYEPRVRDNESRARAGRPLRGDPMAGPPKPR